MMNFAPLLLAVGLASAEPITCCDQRNLEGLASAAVSIHRALTQPDQHGVRLNSHLYALVGAALTVSKARDVAAADRAAATRVHAAADAVKNKPAGPEVIDAYVVISLELAALARRHVGGRIQLVEAHCDGNFWVQGPAVPLAAPGSSCEPIVIR